MNNTSMLIEIYAMNKGSKQLRSLTAYKNKNITMTTTAHIA